MFFFCCVMLLCVCESDSITWYGFFLLPQLWSAYPLHGNHVLHESRAPPARQGYTHEELHHIDPVSITERVEQSHPGISIKGGWVYNGSLLKPMVGIPVNQKGNPRYVYVEIKNAFSKQQGISVLLTFSSCIYILYCDSGHCINSVSDLLLYLTVSFLYRKINLETL